MKYVLLIHTFKAHPLVIPPKKKKKSPASMCYSYTNAGHWHTASIFVFAQQNLYKR